uniref:Translocase of outer mitochondrial membrane 40 like n=1 Tax=Cyprinodon variegatus TaxID=28743 RepID=A0A3Q2E470_CYPVA
MGSVLALSSNPGHHNWPFSKDHLPSRWDAHPAHWDRPPRWERRDGRLPNPGSFHSLHRSCKDVFPHQIEGVKMIVNKTLSSFFKVSHTLHLSAPLTICAVFQSQQSQFVTWQFETEYRGSDFTAAVTVANPDILRESVILVAHFLQSVSSSLVLGGELVYHRGRAEEGGILTLAGQYSSEKMSLQNISKGGAHASYYHRANKQIQVGVEFEASTRTQETTMSFGYQMELPEANMVFRGSLSRCIIGGVLEKRLTPLPATLIMGAFVNHRGDKLQVGLGVNVG